MSVHSPTMIATCFTPPAKPPAQATAKPSNSSIRPPSNPPAETDQHSSSPSQSPSRYYRCSRCGQPGHNVRRCPNPHVWFRQRCSKCGGTGHNARNCPNTTTCRVCNGLGKLPCSQCAGNGFDTAAKPQDDEAPLSDAQKIMAETIRRRVRRVVGAVAEDGLVLIGSDNAGKRCKRCLGRGFLSCMACSDE